MTKNFNEFFDELNDMANFKNFGEKEETEDKEIIIDGVKVEECSYYNKDNTPYCCEVWDNECEAQNCYFKQCKRLEQENARLKNERTADLVKQIDELKVENERLKEATDGLLKIQYTLADSCKKYSETLQEIMVVVEQILEKGLEPQSVEYQLRLKGKRELASIILDIITKAEEE